MARSGESDRGRAGAARRRATRDAVAEASKLTEAREAARSVGTPARGRQSGDPFTGELRRRDVLPLLVLPYNRGGPLYRNQLMEPDPRVTEGVLSVNPNTMYPL